MSKNGNQNVYEKLSEEDKKYFLYFVKLTDEKHKSQTV